MVKVKVTVKKSDKDSMAEWRELKLIATSIGGRPCTEYVIWLHYSLFILNFHCFHHCFIVCFHQQTPVCFTLGLQIGCVERLNPLHWFSFCCWIGTFNTLRSPPHFFPEVSGNVSCAFEQFLQLVYDICCGLSSLVDLFLLGIILSDDNTCYFLS